MNRRHLLASSAVAAGAGLFASLGLGARRSAAAAEGNFPVKKTPAEWRKILSPDAFAVLRQEATEAPFTSALLHEGRHGTFFCAGCRNPLYASETKYDSGTGWPSFWQAMPDSIGTTIDYKLVYPRTEAHCARCGGHLGHIFDDGPQPTGKRHCINGVALGFQATPVAGG